MNNLSYRRGFSMKELANIHLNNTEQFSKKFWNTFKTYINHKVRFNIDNDKPILNVQC